MSNLVGVGFASSSSSSSAPSRPVAVLQVGGGGVNHAMMFSAQDYALSESVDFTTQRYLRATQFLFSNEVGFFSQFRVGSYYGFRDFLFPSQGGVDWDKRHVFEVLQPTAPCKGYCDVDLLTSGLAESERADVLSHGPTGFVIHLVQFMNSVFLPSLSLKTKTATSSAIVASSTTEEAASALLASDDDVDKASPPSPPPLAGARCSNIGCGNDGSVTVALQPFTAANVVALDSTSLTKMSFHFVFDHPQLLFADNHAVYHFMGWFQVHVLTRTDASDPVRTFFKAIDFCVYTMNQQFRMAGNSKLRKSSAAVNPPFLSPVGITVDGCSTKMPSILAAVKYFTPDITRWPAEGGGAAHTYKEVVDSARSFFLSTLVCPPRTQRVGDGEGFGEGERIVFVQPVPKGEGRVRFSKSFGVTMQEFSSFVRGAGMLSASSDRVGESLGDGGDDDNPVMFDVRDVWVDGASGTQVDGRCIFSFTHTLDFEAEHWRRRMEWNKGHEQPFPTSHVMVLDAERRGGGEDRSRASGTGPGPEGARGGPERPRLLKATSDVGESDGFKVNPAYDGMLWVPNSCLPNEPVIHSIINFMQAVHRQIRKSGWKDDGFEIEEISWSSAVKKVTKYTLEWLSLVVSIRSRQCATAKIVHKDSRICYSIDTTNGELKQLCANKECVSKQSGSGSRGALITGLDNLPERENPSLERELRDISEYVRAKLKDLQLKQKQQVSDKKAKHT